jgi:hypothetical protein
MTPLLSLSDHFLELILYDIVFNLSLLLILLSFPQILL